MKKAMQWLSSEAHSFTFHDYRKDGIDKDMLRTFVNALGLDAVLNKRGTTYRKLPEEVKASLTEQSAVALMLEHEAMIKRPILLHNHSYHVGFSAAQYHAIFRDA